MHGQRATAGLYFPSFWGIIVVGMTRRTANGFPRLALPELFHARVVLRVLVWFQPGGWCRDTHAGWDGVLAKGRVGGDHIVSSRGSAVVHFISVGHAVLVPPLRYDVSLS